MKHSKNHVYAVSYDFKRVYTQDELTDMIIGLAKLLFLVCSHAVSLRNNGKTNFGHTYDLALRSLNTLAEDMKENVFDKAAEDEIEAAEQIGTANQ
jgi:hypothetical protein